MLKNIRETIKAKTEKEHRIREDQFEEFTGDWSAVVAEVQSQPSSLPPPCETPRIQCQLLSWPLGWTPRIHSPTSSNMLLGARTPRKDSLGKVTLPWRTRTSKEKDNTPLQPRRWDGASSLPAWVVASQHQRLLSMEPIL